MNSKRILSLLLVCVLALAALCCASCDKKDDETKTAEAYGFEGTKELAKGGAEELKAPAVTGDASAIKIGVILIGDETEGYTKAHMDGIKAAAAKLGIGENQILWKYKVEETDAVTEAGEQLIADGCTCIFSNSYGHQSYMVELAKKHKDCKFVAMTGDTAAADGLANFSNAFTKIYESRYVSGVIAGMKLKSLVDEGKLTAANYDGDNIRIGYVGAFTYAEVVSGYTAFYLGVKSVVSNVVMDVQFTESWFDFDKEKAAANTLIDKGCVIIGQHADSAGAPTACEAALNGGKVVYSVGYNVDMLDVAPNAALTSATNTWEVYYEYAFANAINGTAITTNWAGGYQVGAVDVTKLGSACVGGTAEKVNEVVSQIKSGALKVFDTSKFTVDGKTVTWAYATDSDGDFKNDKNNVIADGFYHESYVQSAPAFNLNIDGIRWLNK